MGSPASGYSKSAGAPATAERAESWKEAASPRPTGGWQHGDGRPLATLQVGEVVEGRVTNVLHERVWINIGAVRDASFWTKSGNFRVGDFVSGMPIISVNLEKGLVVLRNPADLKTSE